MRIFFFALVLATIGALPAAAAGPGDNDFICDCICVQSGVASCYFTPATSSHPKEYSDWYAKRGPLNGEPAQFFSDCPKPQVCEAFGYSHNALHVIRPNWPISVQSLPMRGSVYVEPGYGEYYSDTKPDPIWSGSGKISTRSWPSLVPARP